MGWGVLGTGWMARAFVEDLIELEGVGAVVVGSRDGARASQFRETYSLTDDHGSYEAVVADPRVEIVYVATPHALHVEHAMLALHHGKAVLCEKPFALDAAEMKRVWDEARARGSFCMEAMWTWHFPAIAALRDLIEQGRIGRLRSIHARFCIAPKFDPRHRMFDKALGGGALLDLGIYPVAFAQFVLRGAPTELKALATFGPTEVDESVNVVMAYPGGVRVSFEAALDADAPHTAELVGTEGRIVVPDFFHPNALLVEPRRGPAETLGFPHQGRGWGLQAVEAMRCLRAGAQESPRMPLSQTWMAMSTLDRIRAEIGLHYPNPGTGTGTRG